MPERRYPKEEIVRRGNAIYNRDILPRIGPNDKGKVVAIDVETGAWEMDSDEMVADDRLLARVPDAEIWFMRAGYDSLWRIALGRAEMAT